MTDMDDGWTAIDNRVKALGHTIEVGALDWIEQILTVAEDKQAKLEVAVDFIRRLERFADSTNDIFLLDKVRETLAQLTGGKTDD